MQLKAEILSTGDEVLTGAIVDTNAAFLAETLTEAGISVSRQTCVGDNLDTLVAIFREMGDRADIVLSTGGLGPTTDDLTAEAAARAASVPLVLDPEALDHLEAYFRERKRAMPEANRKQVCFPEGAERLDNPVGTAPGFAMKIGKALFCFMPGVPHEMRKMMSDEVMPRIYALQGGTPKKNLTRILSIFGVPEGELNQRMVPFAKDFPELRVGYQVKYPGILLKFYPGEDVSEEAERRLSSAVSWAKNLLGESVVIEGTKSMEAVVGELLRKKGGTLALAESCTGGLIASLLTDIPGSSDYFLFSGVTYANQAKTDLLGVSPQILAAFGAVSEETAAAMAEGARRIAKATYGLSVSGIAGPDGGSEEKPVGTVCISLSTPEGTVTERKLFTYGKRLMLKQMFAAAALDLLRRHLLKA